MSLTVEEVLEDGHEPKVSTSPTLEQDKDGVDDGDPETANEGGGEKENGDDESKDESAQQVKKSEERPSSVFPATNEQEGESSSSSPPSAASKTANVQPRISVAGSPGRRTRKTEGNIQQKKSMEFRGAQNRNRITARVGGKVYSTHRTSLDPEVIALYQKTVHMVEDVTDPHGEPYTKILDVTAEMREIGGAGGLVSEPWVTACSVRLLSVTEINVINGTFRVEGQIDVRWFDPEYVDKEFNTVIPTDEVSTLVEKPFIRNSGADMEVSGGPAGVLVQPFPNDPPGLCRYYWTFKGVCTEMFRLEMFPFDNQDLTVEVFFFSTGVPSSRSFGRIIVPETQWDPSNSLRKSSWWKYGIECNTLLEWDMFEPRVAVCGGQNKPHRYVFKAQVLRKYRYFTINVMAATGGISSLAFTAFAIRPANRISTTVGRLQIVAAYLLTTVAFKFVIADSLPKVSYMTVLDKYFMWTMAFNSMLSVVIAVMAAVSMPPFFESIIVGLLFFSWVAYHIHLYNWCTVYIQTVRKSMGTMIPGKKVKEVPRRGSRVLFIPPNQNGGNNGDSGDAADSQSKKRRWFLLSCFTRSRPKVTPKNTEVTGVRSV